MTNRPIEPIFLVTQIEPTYPAINVDETLEYIKRGISEALGIPYISKDRRTELSKFINSIYVDIINDKDKENKKDEI